MKIGIIAHLKHPIRSPFKGGLEAFTHLITRKLMEAGHEVLLFASSSSDESLPLIPILSDAHYDEATGHRIKQADLPSEYIAEHHAYYQLMMQIDAYQLDVVFNNSLHYIPITMANIIQTQMATVLHTPPFYELQIAIKRERENPTIQYISVSDQNAENWEPYVQDCETIPNAIELKDWEFYAQHQDSEYAVWFGRIHPDKGLHFAIQASRLAGLPLKVAGGIADKRYYREKIEPLLGDDIELVGLCTHSKLNTLIGNAAVCLVTPTWQEPFGLVVAEAMACGTPVAGFRMGALTKLIPPGCGTLADFPDCEALAEAILQAKKADRAHVRAFAEHHFNIDHMIHRYIDLLSQVANKQSKIQSDSYVH